MKKGTINMIFIIRIYFYIFKVAFLLGVAGHLVEATGIMRKESFKAFKHGQLNLSEFNKSLVGKQK